ncbi:MAG TPA: hypothetical protein VIP05_05915 [Burkholderiaceae bacterium]
MPSRPASSFLERLREFWRSLAPEGDDARFEFHWRGLPLLVDRRADTVLRGGRLLVKVGDVRTIDATRFQLGEDDRDRWKVSLATGALASVEIGRTMDDVEASIAAARLSTALGVKVRAL